jgi:type VI secretion system protein ImpH
VPAEQRARLGLDACTLGEDAILGFAVPCHTGKIGLEFSELDGDALRGLLPGTRLAAVLHDLVRNYCREPLEYEVTLHLRSREAGPLSPGGDARGNFARLGYDTWLGCGGEHPAAPLDVAGAFFPAGFTPQLTPNRAAPSQPADLTGDTHAQ